LVNGIEHMARERLAQSKCKCNRAQGETAGFIHSCWWVAAMLVAAMWVATILVAAKVKITLTFSLHRKNEMKNTKWY